MKYQPNFFVNFPGQDMKEKNEHKRLTSFAKNVTKCQKKKNKWIFAYIIGEELSNKHLLISMQVSFL